MGLAAFAAATHRSPAMSDSPSDTSCTACRPDSGVPTTLRVNGASHALTLDPRATLLDTLRETLHLTGTKKGCDHGQCGACTVHMAGRRVNACLALAVAAPGRDIPTTEVTANPPATPPSKAALVPHNHPTDQKSRRW